MNKLEQKAITERNIQLCYYLSVLKNNKDITQLEQVVLDSKNVLYNYKYARDVKYADIKAHEQIILDSRDPEYNFYFAVSVPNSNILAHEQIVNESKNLEYNFRFAMVNDGIRDISTEEEVILESGKPYYIYMFAKTIENANITKHIDKLQSYKVYNGLSRKLKQTTKESK